MEILQYPHEDTTEVREKITGNGLLITGNRHVRKQIRRLRQISTPPHNEKERIKADTSKGICLYLRVVLKISLS
ncbi:MAG: hypothetical protein IJT13_00925 [Bacteroidaceae bacterium]|nr:hypothetical protein [Bacteroidaceae bacterium]